MTSADRADYVLRLIAARCPELSLAAIESALADRDAEATIPAVILERIEDVLAAMEARLAVLEST